MYTIRQHSKTCTQCLHIQRKVYPHQSGIQQARQPFKIRIRLSITLQHSLPCSHASQTQRPISRHLFPCRALTTRKPRRSYLSPLLLIPRPELETTRTNSLETSNDYAQPLISTVCLERSEVSLAREYSAYTTPKCLEEAYVYLSAFLRSAEE